MYDDVNNNRRDNVGEQRYLEGMKEISDWMMELM